MGWGEEEGDFNIFIAPVNLVCELGSCVSVHSFSFPFKFLFKGIFFIDT